jgi:carbamoyl-phosphate synthase large subunit
MAAAEKVGEALRGQAFGALCFQAMVNASGEATVFELNARFGGGYPLADHAGAHFAKWLMEAVLGLPSSANNSWRDDVTMLRYDAAVFASQG